MSPGWGCPRRLVAVAVLGALTAVAEARGRGRRPAAGAELTAADLRWPATTRSATVRTASKVYAQPGGKGRRVGKLARGTRVAWTRIVASRDRCQAWLAIEPHGWACARDLAPSADPPAATLEPGRIVAETEAKELLGVVPAGARAFASVRAIRRGRPARTLRGWTMVREPGARIVVGDVAYRETEHGLVAEAAIELRRPSTFAGVDLRAPSPPGWPFAWVTPRRRDAMVSVRAAPDARARELRVLVRRELVPVLERQGGFARIGAGAWVGLDELRVAAPSPRPDGVAADERWLDVDLDQQVLVAYEGDVPVYATLVSTGKGRSTPTGIHRIEKKLARTRLKAPDVSLGEWDLPDVPFSMRFRKYYAVHGVYWHDSFGKPRSQGCVNLSPRDARFVFEWSHPQVPAGWLDAKDTRRGTPIRLRNRRDPDPGWVDYDTDPPPSVRLRAPATAAAAGDDGDDD